MKKSDLDTNIFSRKSLSKILVLLSAIVGLLYLYFYDDLSHLVNLTKTKYEAYNETVDESNVTATIVEHLGEKGNFINYYNFWNDTNAQSLIASDTNYETVQNVKTTSNSCYAIDWNSQDSLCWLHRREDVVDVNPRPVSGVTHYKRTTHCQGEECWFKEYTNHYIPGADYFGKLSRWECKQRCNEIAAAAALSEAEENLLKVFDNDNDVTKSDIDRNICYSIDWDTDQRKCFINRNMSSKTLVFDATVNHYRKMQECNEIESCQWITVKTAKEENSQFIGILSLEECKAKCVTNFVPSKAFTIPNEEIAAFYPTKLSLLKESKTLSSHDEPESSTTNNHKRTATLSPSSLYSRDFTNNMCSHDQRKEHIKSTCAAETAPLPKGGTRLIVDDMKKLMLCEVSKSGCTTWTALWLHSNMNPGKNLTETSMKYKGETVHNANLYGRYGMKLILQSQVPERYLNYTKVLVVRNPFDRVVSGYFNMIYWKPGLGDAAYYVKNEIYKFYPHIKGNIAHLNFRQFVEYITNPSAQYYHDRHWDPYSRTCEPCRVHYDYIIRLETMNEYAENDALPVLKILGYDKSILQKRKLTQMNSRTRMDKQERASKYSKLLPIYKQLPKELFQKLVNRYRLDLKLFGYSYDELTNLANCYIENQACC